MAGVKDVFSPFNRVVANVEVVKTLKNEEMSSILFINTNASKFKVVEQYSGAISDSDITKEFPGEKLQKKIRAALTQIDTSGNSLTPKYFYVADVPIGAEAVVNDVISQLESAISNVVLKYQRHFCVLVFDDCTHLSDEILERLDNLLISWKCFAWLLFKEISEITEKKSKLTYIGGIKAHKIGDSEYEEIADAAFIGNVISSGVGKADGEAKTLKGVTADTLATTDLDNGDLTITEALKWSDEKNVTVYATNLYGYDETSGMKFLNGEELVNRWELCKVILDLSMDLTQLRHERRRMGVADFDEADVRTTIINRLDILKVDPKNPNKTTALIADYKCSVIELDRTLEDNINKFAFDIQISLRGVTKWFSLNATAYQDGRMFVEEA